MGSAETQLAGLPTAPGSARAFVRTALDAWDLERLGPVVELLTSELVSNAVLHGRAPVTLRVARHTVGIRVEVEDASPAAPTLHRSRNGELGGRGILIVDRLATSWGVDVRASGKTVWFEVE